MGTIGIIGAMEVEVKELKEQMLSLIHISEPTRH